MKIKKVDKDRLKSIQLEILIYVASYCEKNNIHYWLDGGTLLGAIRHRGYIPWDDDIDIGMQRLDYNRFIETFNENNDRYKAYSIEIDDSFLYPFTKVLDTKTILYEPDEKGNKLSVNIDIFPYDICPVPGKETKKMFYKRTFLLYLHILRTLHGRPRGNVLRRLTIYIIRMILRIFPPNLFCKKIIQNARKYEHSNETYIGNFCGSMNAVWNKDVVGSFMKTEFEGHQFEIMTNYNDWLREYYGDYMKLPPEKDRVSHHTFQAYEQA